MRTIITLAAIATLLSTTQLAAQTQADAIIALWDTGEVQVEVIKSEEGRYIGNPVKPDGTINTAINILDLEYADSQWSGKVYNRDKEKYFDVVCELSGDTLILKVTAGFIKRTVEWAKAN